MPQDGTGLNRPKQSMGRRKPPTRRPAAMRAAEAHQTAVNKPCRLSLKIASRAQTNAKLNP